MKTDKDLSMEEEFPEAVEIAHEAGFAGTSWVMWPEDLDHLLKIYKQKILKELDERKG